MLRRHLSARFTHFKATPGGIARACVVVLLIFGVQERGNAAADPVPEDIRLELSPRICTLSGSDKQCEAEVRANWRAAHEESLCLVIVDRPEVKRCWENYAEGSYTILLVFSDDVIFQLKDLELQQVLASEALRVIREALHYRHKRREPWNIFD
jgi:hypothetical protein